MSHRSIGGMKLALGTILGLNFIVVVGMWPEAMISVYLCGIALVFCIWDINRDLGSP